MPTCQNTKNGETELPLEELAEINPEAAKEEMLKLEKERAADRASLRHKNTSKWAKGMMRHHAHDADTKYVIRSAKIFFRFDSNISLLTPPSSPVTH